MSSLVEWMDHRFYPQARSQWDAALFRRLIEAHLGERSAVLDLGAGRGAVADMDIRRPGVFVAGVDVDRAVLDNPFLHEKKVLNADGSIPYHDQSFDLVLAHNVLEHLAEPSAVFREVHRVLRHNGVFLAKTPNRRHYVPTIARLTPHRFHVWVNHRRGQDETDVFPTVYRCNTPEAIAKLASTAAFSVEAVTLIEGRPEYLRGSAPSYAAGLLYERLMNSSPRLSRFRAVMLTTLRKVDHEVVANESTH